MSLKSVSMDSPFVRNRGIKSCTFSFLHDTPFQIISIVSDQASHRTFIFLPSTYQHVLFIRALGYCLWGQCLWPAGRHSHGRDTSCSAHLTLYQLELCYRVSLHCAGCELALAALHFGVDQLLHWQHL